MSHEPSTHRAHTTHRMRADEVRALIRMLEPQPPPHADIHDESEREASREREPPTLLYRRSSRHSPPSGEPRTKPGLGSFTTHETTARALSRMDASAPSAHERAVVCEPEVLGARVPASERVRMARRRSILFCGVIVALVAFAPGLMAIVRRTAGPDAPASVEGLVRDGDVAADAARVTRALDVATQDGADGVRRATELLMEGDSASALSAFRELSRAHPEHFALGHVVHSLEEQLRACARGEGEGAACR